MITVAFNAEATIADTVTSIRGQDWLDFEHIIIDGASSDRTVAIVHSLDHARLTLVSERDDGCYDAMNKGLALATGNVVAFINADDFLASSDVLTQVARCFAATGADGVGGQTIIVSPEDLDRPTRKYRSRGFRPWMLRFGHMPPHPSLYLKREKVMGVRGFDTRYRIAGDFDQLVKLFARRDFKFATLEIPLSIFREGGISTRGLKSRLTMNREILRSLRGNAIISHPLLLWLRYPFKALQYFGRFAPKLLQK